VKEKPTVFSPFCESFLPDRIILATKDFIDFFFIYSFTISLKQKFL